MKLKSSFYVSAVFLLIFLVVSCTNIPIPHENPDDAPAPEIYFENNFGFNYLHFPKAKPVVEDPLLDVFPAEWFGNSYGFITSPSNQAILNATLEVYRVLGGRDVPSSYTTVYGPIDLTLSGGTHFDHDWTETFIALAAGKYELRITATDALGKTNYRALTFFVHGIFLQDTKGNNVDHLTTENIAVNVLGLTGNIEFTLYDSDFVPVSPQPELVGNQIQIGQLPQGGYNLYVSSANGVLEEYYYSFFVTNGNGPTIRFYNNPESGNTSYTGDGFVEWRIANYGPQVVEALLYRESSHTRQMMFNPVYSIWMGDFAVNTVESITSSWFTINDQRSKVDVVGVDTQGNCSTKQTQYSIYKGMSSEYLYFYNSANYEPVYPGEIVTLELELKNVKDFAAFYTKMVTPGFLSIEDINVTFPSIKGSSSKTEVQSVGPFATEEITILEILKAVVDTPGAPRETFTANGIFLRITFKIPDYASAGFYPIGLTNTLIRDANNHEKGEVRDDLSTWVVIGDR